jgi:ribonucleotide monophosphatase NagD (HAD superfamily)
MIGDDIESDIKGAQAIGIKSVLVHTGKFLPKDLERPDVTPWKTIESIRNLKEIL